MNRVHIWGFYVWVTGRPAARIAAVVFTIAGLLIALWLPSLVQPEADRGVLISVLRVIGGVFFCLGALLGVWMAVDWYLGQVPQYRERWFWWGNFVLSLVAAGLFAVPATLLGPGMLLAYALRPNAFFPGRSGREVDNLIVGGIFFVAGLVGLVGMFLIGRQKYRERPSKTSKL